MDTIKTILLIDDDELYARAVTIRLESSGFKVITLCKDIDTVLEVIEANKIDLVLLDLIMPHSSGKKVLEKIRTKHERNVLPVIIVTGMNDSFEVTESFTLGANDYLTKPIAMDVAIARINAHIAQCNLDRIRVKKKQLQVLNAMIITYCHEINNPLSVVIAEMMNLEKAHPELHAQYLSRAKNSMERINVIMGKIKQAGDSPEVIFQDYAGNSKMIKLG